jgi:hypothetical protein
VVVCPVTCIVEVSIFAITASVAPNKELTVGSNFGLVLGQDNGVFGEVNHDSFGLVELTASTAVTFAATVAVEEFAQVALVVDGEDVLSHCSDLSVFTALGLLLIQPYTGFVLRATPRRHYLLEG